MEAFKAFRDRLHQHFRTQADTLINLLDGLRGNHNAHSAVEISLEPTLPGAGGRGAAG